MKRSYFYHFIFISIYIIFVKNTSSSSENLPTKVNNNNKVIRLNVGGEIFMTTRSTLTYFKQSILDIMLHDHWEQRLSRDQNGNIFLDFNPILFRHLIEQLRLIGSYESHQIYPPLSPILIEPFEKMLQKLRINQFNKSIDIVELNVGGDVLTIRKKLFKMLSNYTSDKFIDLDPKAYRLLINKLREKTNIDIVKVDETMPSVSTTNHPSLNELATIIKPFNLFDNIDICLNATWDPNGITVAGGHGQGANLNQLNHPMGLYIDENLFIYIADTYNHRIMKWSLGSSYGEIISDFNHSKNYISNLVVSKNDSIFFCDRLHYRVEQFFIDSNTSQTILSNVSCWGLALDDKGSLYISDHDNHRIIKWPQKEIVAGGNGEGYNYHQLSTPYQIFIDRNQSIYIADYFNHRIMKWSNDFDEGVVVAGGNGYGSNMNQLKLPHSVVVDHMGTIYIVDFGNDRIMRWFNNSETGLVIIGNNGVGNETNQLSNPYDLKFDRQGNLFVCDTLNHRIQMYRIDKSLCGKNE